MTQLRFDIVRDSFCAVPLVTVGSWFCGPSLPIRGLDHARRMTLP